MRAVYRLRQGLANLGARMRPEDWALVDRYLSEPERRLFRQMSPPDQCHSVGVLRSLLKAGVEDEDLLKAGLLHDVGKSASRTTIFHRTAAVLFGGIIDSTLPVMMDWPSSPHWRPFQVIANHPRIGASMLARAGSPERVWRLVELHQVDPKWLERGHDEEWMRWALKALQAADNEN